METSLKRFRDEYRESLLRFLWKEWTALGVAGQDGFALRHAVDPEPLLLFTCALGRQDQRLFDEVIDWLTKNGRFLNIQRMKNILRQEVFSGGPVLSAVADWLLRRGDPMKWRLLAELGPRQEGHEALFYLPEGRPLPPSAKNDETFLMHGFVRNPVELRGYSRAFPADAAPCRLLRMRALFGVNARCDVLTYLALNKTGHPREVARELYYSQKAIHDVMRDLECSGLVHSSRVARERTFRLAAHALPFLVYEDRAPGWINWPALLSTAERVWWLTEELCTAKLDPLVESSEILLTMKPLLERIMRAPWAPAIPNGRSLQGIAQLQVFQTVFETVAV